MYGEIRSYANSIWDDNNNNNNTHAKQLCANHLVMVPIFFGPVRSYIILRVYKLGTTNDIFSPITGGCSEGLGAF